MVAKTKAARKKRKISKHVLKAREDKTSKQQDDAEDTAEIGVVDAPTPTEPEKKPKKSKHIKDPSEAWSYLTEWKASRTGKGNWRFNKNTQSWLIRHLYEIEKVPKGEFALLLEYLGGLEGNSTRTRMRAEASRRALRYKEFAAKTDTEKGEEEEPTEGETSKSPKKTIDDSKSAEEQADEQQRWQKLSDHDKRKEYKRARKILEEIKET